jgi:hypothetical protein
MNSNEEARINTPASYCREIPALGECFPKLRWDIKKDRHAALVMIDVNYHEINFEGRLHKFIQNIPELAEKAFVTKLYRCSTYARLVTDYGQCGEVYIGFRANTKSAPTVSATTAAPSHPVIERWETFSQLGNWTTGVYHPFDPPYTPLATLRQITPKGPVNGFRDSIPPDVTDEEEMKDYIPPWGELDERGDQIDD